MALHVGDEAGGRFFNQEFRDAIIVAGDESMSFSRLIIGGLRHENETDTFVHSEESMRQAGVFALLRELAQGDDEVVITVTSRSRVSLDTMPPIERAQRYSRFDAEAGNTIVTLQDLRHFYRDTTEPGKHDRPGGTWSRLQHTIRRAPSEYPDLDLERFVHMDNHTLVGIFAHRLPQLLEQATDCPELMSPRDHKRLSLLASFFKAANMTEEGEQS